jgi:outer membrane autotransporter protein
MSARASSANIDTTHLAAYAGADYGALNVRSGAAFAWSTIATSRSILFPGFIDSASAHYGAGTGQVFGEIGYAKAFGNAAVEPFAGLAYVHLDTGSFTEAGGVAALAGSRTTEDVGYSSLGLRLATSVVLANGITLVPRASGAWQHALGDATPTAALAFLSTGASFTMAGAPLARDAAVVETGFDLRLTPQAKIGVSYFGQLAAGLQDHAVKGNFTWYF